jgi:hypothetical protein
VVVEVYPLEVVFGDTMVSRRSDLYLYGLP